MPREWFNIAETQSFDRVRNRIPSLPKLTMLMLNNADMQIMKPACSHTLGYPVHNVEQGYLYRINEIHTM